MSKIVLQLTVNEGTNESFDNFTADKVVNNVSLPVGETTTVSAGRYGKSLSKGFLTFNNGYLGDSSTKLMSEVEKYNGYMFGATNSKGEYGLTLTLSGSNFDRIIIYGDADAGQWATEAIVDGKTIYSDDSIWAIAFEQESNVHTIQFRKWNKSNYNACITHIAIMLKYLDLGTTWIDDLDSLSQTTTAPNEIVYGVLPNSGTANIRDLNGELRDYINDGLLSNSNVPITLLVNDTPVQAHISVESSYNDSDTLLTLHFTNKLADWDNLIYNGRTITSGTSAYMLLVDILSSLGYSVNEIDEMLTDNVTPLSFDKNGAGNIQIIGSTGSSSTGINSTNEVWWQGEYDNFHKYFVSFDVTANQEGYTTGLFLPQNTSPTGIPNHGVIGDATTEWTTIAGFIQENGVDMIGSGMKKVTLWNNNEETDVTMTYKNLFITDLTVQGLEDKDLDWCVTHIRSRNIIFGNNNNEGSIKEYLEQIIIPAPFLESDTYRNTINSICNLAQLNVYEDDNGKIKFVTARPLALEADIKNAVRITDTFIEQDLEKSLILKNKYDNVQVDEHFIDLQNIMGEHGYEYSVKFKDTVYSFIQEGIVLRMATLKANGDLRETVVETRFLDKDSNDAAFTIMGVVANDDNIYLLVSDDTDEYSQKYYVLRGFNQYGLFDELEMTGLGVLVFSSGMNNITYGNGKFVMLVSENHLQSTQKTYIFQSTDCITWTKTEISDWNYAAIYHLMYAHDRFVGTGYFGNYQNPLQGTPTVVYSTNGTTWYTVQNNNVPNNISASETGFMGIRYADKAFCTSTNGVTWTKKSGVFTNMESEASKIQYGNGSYVVIYNNVNYDSFASYSFSAGADWHEFNLKVPSFTIINSVYFLINNFVAFNVSPFPRPLLVLRSHNGQEFRNTKISSVDSILKSYGNGTNKFNYPQSKLIQVNSMFQGTPLSNAIATIILGDYKEGINNGNVTLFVGDFYNSKGDKIIRWNRGEIIKVNNIVYFDGDTYVDKTQRYWKVTGRNFRWDGQPLIDLQLQEVRQQIKWGYGMLLNLNSGITTVPDPDKVFDFYINDTKVLYNSLIMQNKQLKIIQKSYGYGFSNLKVNGQAYTLGTEISVSNKIYITGTVSFVLG